MVSRITHPKWAIRPRKTPRASIGPIAALVAACGAVGCASSAPGASMAQLQNRAVYDLGCGAGQVAVYHLDERTKAAVGCGRRLLYVESCQTIRGRHACTWVMNTPSFAQAQWPQWYAAPKPATYVVLPQGQAPAGRPMATTLFGPEGGSAPSAGRPSSVQPAAATGSPTAGWPQVAPSTPPAAGSAAAPPAPSTQPQPGAIGPQRATPPHDDERGRIISTELFE